MMKDFVRSTRVKEEFFDLVFDDGRNNGYAFPCNADGVVDLSNMADCAVDNLEFCKSNPDKFERFCEVVKSTRWYTEPAEGTCHCGIRFKLHDEYMGACECPKCGQWYNLFGQELINPKYWEDEEA